MQRHRACVIREKNNCITIFRVFTQAVYNVLPQRDNIIIVGCSRKFCSIILDRNISFEIFKPTPRILYFWYRAVSYMDKFSFMFIKNKVSVLYKYWWTKNIHFDWWICINGFFTNIKIYIPLQKRFCGGTLCLISVSITMSLQRSSLQYNSS